MEVRYLVYKGAPVTKSIIVRQESATSPWRNLKVYPGLRMEIGKQIPERIASFLMEMRSSMFDIEKKELDTLEVVKGQFQEIIEFYNKHFEKDAPSVVPALLVEGLFSVMGDSAFTSLVTAIQKSQAIGMSETDRINAIENIFSKVEDEKPVEAPKPKPKPARKKAAPKRKAPPVVK